MEPKLSPRLGFELCVCVCVCAHLCGSPPTADMDFCEPNYTTSHLVAEFWNTITSIPIIFVGVFGMVLCHVQQLGGEQMLSYAMVGVIGLGSFLFHATLMRTGQVLDEVPMLWATLVLVYTIYHHTLDRSRRKLRGDPTRMTSRLKLVGAGMLAYAAAATCVYFTTGFLFFVIAYGVSVLVTFLLALSSFFSASSSVGDQPRRMLVCAGMVYGGGFLLLWLPGEVLCHRIPIIERLPLHALFHLTSAAGPHLGLTAFALARFEDEQPTAPPSAMFAGLPAIQRARPKRI
jgi:dihydroceramidase